MTGLALTGLTTGPGQVWGGVRLVPLLRARPIEDLRLHRRLHDDAAVPVDLGGRASYHAFIPHAFVASWTDDGTPAAAFGTQFESARPPRGIPVRAHRRLARREAARRLRFLPMHLALEGYLALHFGGPEIAWEQWSRRAIGQGLSPREEQAFLGLRVRGLEDALRLFEIHPGQCGVAVYTADALVSIFVVPHPSDYRALHETLLLDLFGETVYHYSRYARAVPDFAVRVEDARSLAELRLRAHEQAGAWAAFHDGLMAGGLLGADYAFEEVRGLGRFRLARFLPPFTRGAENHIGEAIHADDGELAYLKTFRLSENQTRRAHLLVTLAAHDWRLEATAAALGTTEDLLVRRIAAAGFGVLLRRDLRERHRPG